MNFDLKKPCANCPFRTDPPFFLHPERRREIADSLRGDGYFPCHKTVNYDRYDDGDDEDFHEQYVPSGDESFCAGALIVMVKNDHEWVSNGFLRVSQRLGMFDPNALDLDAPTFVGLDEFEKGPD